MKLSVYKTHGLEIIIHDQPQTVSPEIIAKENRETPPPEREVEEADRWNLVASYELNHPKPDLHLAVLALRMKRAYDGFSKAFGRFKVTGTSAKGKKEGEVKTITTHGPTLDDFYGHMTDADKRIGIIMLRDDLTLRFGDIDIDVYDGSLD